ncbi:MAG: phosphate ABC transporter permease subunit PstC [Solirubrobacteraceae bacterium]
MTTSTPAVPAPPGISRAGRKLADRLGDPTLRALCGLASVLAVVLLALLAYKVFDQSSASFSKFGFAFVGHQTWDPNSGHFGAADFIFGTLVSSAVAILIAAPMSIGIALYLTELAPRAVRRPVAILVELLAAIPSVVLGLWGILVLAPFMNGTLEPALHSVLGWIPLFGGTPSGSGLLTAALVLTIMAVPIISAVTREVFETVPAELKEGAYALGATRWEMIRMTILPYARPGIVGGLILGLGRALGEAIAVTQVIGGTQGIHSSLFGPADTLASRIASEYQGATSTLQVSSLFYLSAILLVIALLVNAGARLIVRRVTIANG